MCKSSIFQLGLMAILAVACVTEPKEVPQVPGGEELVAGIENSGTRTVVNEDLQVLWETADQISVFLQTTENRPYELQGEGGVATGKFSRTTKQSPEYYAAVPYNYGVYPYFSGTSISADGVITLELPAEQAYAENSFGPCANVMVAASEDKTLNFKNLNGYICVRLTGDVAVETVSLISNTGEMLAGTAQVTVKPDAEPVVTFAEEGGIGSVTVLCEKPVQLSSEETLFWVVVPPATYPEGFTLTVTYNGGQEFVLEGSSSLELARSTVVKMPVVNIVAPKTLPYAEPFDAKTELGAFTIQDVTIPEGLNYVWTLDKTFGAKGSAYYNQIQHQAESWLVSPEIDLKNETQAGLSFKYALNYGDSKDYASQFYLMVNDGKGWSRVDIQNLPTVAGWTFYDAVVDLTAFCGNQIQLAFVYNSIGQKSALTIEVKDVLFDRTVETVITAPSALTLSVGDDPEALDASANSGVKLIYTSSDETVATVSAEGVVTPVAEGTATITITAPGLNSLTPAEVTCTVTVLPKGEIDYTETYTSNVELSTKGGTSASTCSVIVDEESYSGLKAGTGSKKGALVVAVPKGTTKLHFHAFGWNGEKVTLSITGGNASPASITLVSDSGVKSNSPFTLTTATNSYYCVSLSGVTTDTDITFTATSGNRFILWGVNAE